MSGDKKWAIVTGGSRGLGYETAKGLIAAGILAVVTVLMCDFSCNESPVYIGVFIAFPIFYVIGAFIGFFWKNRMVRIIMLTIFGFLIIWFLIVYISELSG